MRRTFANCERERQYVPPPPPPPLKHKQAGTQTTTRLNPSARTRSEEGMGDEECGNGRAGGMLGFAQAENRHMSTRALSKAQRIAHAEEQPPLSRTSTRGAHSLRGIHALKTRRASLPRHTRSGALGRGNCPRVTREAARRDPRSLWCCPVWCGVAEGDRPARTTQSVVPTAKRVPPGLHAPQKASKLADSLIGIAVTPRSQPWALAPSTPAPCPTLCVCAAGACM
eukprot:6211081-Pleurochrysis_carterae.AAC.9